jgi:UDP-N-acetylglucosamine 2-epimerase (non-hydrolysing)/UDP-GlcNAc3NAcA epimerase
MLRLSISALQRCAGKLKKEGLGDRSYCVGNIMYDSFLHFADQPWDHPNILGFDGNPVEVPDQYYYMTCHRQENTYSDEPLTEILLAMNSLDAPTIYAVHRGTTKEQNESWRRKVLLTSSLRSP